MITMIDGFQNKGFNSFHFVQYVNIIAQLGGMKNHGAFWL